MPELVAGGVLQLESPDHLLDRRLLRRMDRFLQVVQRAGPASIADGHAAERSALARCARAIYSSDWAAAIAVKTYDADLSKVRVVPFGGNLSPTTLPRPRWSPWSPPATTGDATSTIGVDWERKGADIAVEAVRA